jgi:hypothetical protein
MDKTIQMSRESWIDVYGLGHDRAKFIDALKHFEALVRADERALAFVKLEQRVKEAYQDGHTAGAKSEREACAKVCEELVPDMSRTANDASVWDVATFDCAAAIRERGNT